MSHIAYKLFCAALIALVAVGAVATCAYLSATEAHAQAKQPKPLLNWTIEDIIAHNTIQGCKATRMYPGGVSVTVTSLVGADKYTSNITIEGVAFDVFAQRGQYRGQSDYGIWKVDDNDEAEIFGQSPDEWTTTIKVPSQTSNSLLNQFAKGRKLRLLFGENYHDFDLSETEAMTKTLKQCIDSAGARSLKRRLSVATAARTRLPT